MKRLLKNLPQGYQAKGTDEVVIDTEECYLVITGYEINTNYDCLEVYYYFENRMDKDISELKRFFKTIKTIKQMLISASAFKFVTFLTKGLTQI